MQPTPVPSPGNAEEGINFQIKKTTTMKKETWEFVKYSSAYRDGTGAYDIVKSNFGKYAVGYDANSLVDGSIPSYYVHYCDSLDEAEGYAAKELS